MCTTAQPAPCCTRSPASGGEGLGFSVAGIGDVDDDGVPDYATGAPFAGGAQSFGRLVVISGATHQILHDLNGEAGSLFGYDINAAGDLNHDGRGDIVVGAITGGPAQEGTVSIISGTTGSVIWSATGVDAGGWFGAGVSGMQGDLNGDGVPDQVIGAPFAGPAGTGNAYFLSGADGSQLRTLVPLATAGSLGWFFAHAAGDVNGDGVADAYVGDFSDGALGPFSGRAYVYSGADGTMLQVYDAELPGDGFGIGRGAGDVNGDGYPDLFLAGYTNSFAANQGGKANLYSGRDQGLIRSFTGTTDLYQLGFDAVALGDVNGNGYTDYLITGNDVAYVVAGRDASPRARIASVCQLLKSLPEELYAPPASPRKRLLCGELARVQVAYANGRAAVAAHILQSGVRAHMDGSDGGNPQDDWLTDAAYQAFVLRWVNGLAAMIADH